MEKSIFSGLSLQNLRIAWTQAQQSPEGMGAVVLVAVLLILALAFAGAMTAHHLGGFYTKLQEDEEREREEQEACESAEQEKKDMKKAMRDETGIAEGEEA